MNRHRVCSYEELLDTFDQAVEYFRDEDEITDEFKNGFFHALNFVKDAMDQMNPSYIIDLENVTPANKTPT